MNEYLLSPQAIVMVQGSSKGAQRKYYEDGYWYKVNNAGYEGLAEYLVSRVLECSNIKDFVRYEQCKVNGRAGCRSESFLGTSEAFLSFQRLYELYTGENLQERIRLISDVSGRIRFVVDFVIDHTGLDCTEYLSQILTLDMLVLNTDRHFHNLGIVVNSITGEYKAAPVFDNGNSLLSDWEMFSEETIEENIEHVYGQPFSASLENQAYEAGIGLKLDYNRLDELLSYEPESRGMAVLRYQLERYRKMISIA